MKLSIGENIKTMRRKCGFTQEELAAVDLKKTFMKRIYIKSYLNLSP